MTVYSVVRHVTFGVFSGLLLAALTLSHAWAMHEQVPCRACHLLKPNAKEGVTKELRAPVRRDLRMKSFDLFIDSLC